MIDIKGYDGKYLIDEKGNVYSKAKNRFLKPCKSIRGYMVVSLNKKTRTVHQLVAETFIDFNYKSKGLVIDHTNRDKTDNNLTNLRLVSKSDNFKNSDYYENMVKGSIKLRSSGSFRVRLVRNGAKFDKTFKLREEAERYLANLQKEIENADK